MQPYVNPNLFLNPMYGNYMQNQMPQTQMQPVGISGRYVNDFNEINASDISMSSPSIFPKNDRSEIQIREWNPNGQIVTTTFKPVVEQIKETAPVPTIDTETILDKLEELNDKIEKLSKPTPRVKKETE